MVSEVVKEAYNGDKEASEGSKFNQGRDEPFFGWGPRLTDLGSLPGPGLGIFCLERRDFYNSFNLTTVEGPPIFNLKL